MNLLFDRPSFFPNHKSYHITTMNEDGPSCLLLKNVYFFRTGALPETSCSELEKISMKKCVNLDHNSGYDHQPGDCVINSSFRLDTIENIKIIS